MSSPITRARVWLLSQITRPEQSKVFGLAALCGTGVPRMYGLPTCLPARLAYSTVLAPAEQRVLNRFLDELRSEVPHSDSTIACAISAEAGMPVAFCAAWAGATSELTKVFLLESLSLGAAAAISGRAVPWSRPSITATAVATDRIRGRFTVCS